MQRIQCNLRPDISKLQMIMVPQERLVWTYVSFLSFVHIRATKAPGQLKNVCSENHYCTYTYTRTLMAQEKGNCALLSVLGWLTCQTGYQP